MENFSCQRCICSDPFLRPPEVPIFKSTSPQAKSEMLKMQKESKVYQSYLELCGNKTNVPVYSKTSSTTAQTTIVPGVTTLKDMTTEVTNITSLQNDTLVPPTSILSSSSQDSDGWIAPVVIVIILLFIAVIVGGVYLYKKKGKKGTASFSSVGSKKSESSVGQIQPNSRIDQDVVYYTQVSNNEKDFKHSSTAQLIDAPLSHTDEEYSNPAIECTDVKLDLYENSSKVSFRQSYSSDTQTDNKASHEDSKIESDTSQKEDSETVGKADTIVSTFETCSLQTMPKPITDEKADTILSTYKTCSLQTMSKPTTDEKADTILSTYETLSPETMSKPTTKEKESDTRQSEEDSSSEKPSSGTDIESVYITLTSETEESSSKKPQFNIDLESHTTGDGRKSSIQNQKSVDSGYESKINSPEQECV
ncbi:uncharacterized protein LOC134270368 isoform X2 [Saccostrea cucullata]|uniref:uncharacterized protein LOC134270368 isoform X2 n=1 Tax=Saccostrea cuccullata TaxID=36930 RepID=UPI002ED25472